MRGLSYDESVKNPKALYTGALLLEAVVLTLLWLVGHYFSLS